jgi:hypothetical protein
MKGKQSLLEVHAGKRPRVSSSRTFSAARASMCR